MTFVGIFFNNDVKGKETIPDEGHVDWNINIFVF